MDEFNTIERVQEIFRSINALGSDNTFIVTCKDTQKAGGGLVGGMVEEMENPYDGLLINDYDMGIVMFYLKSSGLNGGLTGWASPSKMTLDKANYIFIPRNNVKEVIIKKFALLNSKMKRIQINTLDGKSYKLYARVEESDFPYHKDNFAKFMAKYGSK